MSKFTDLVNFPISSLLLTSNLFGISSSLAKFLIVSFNIFILFNSELIDLENKKANNNNDKMNTPSIVGYAKDS
ncbi:Uncharacterised protein [Chlamydia trachomatis]|nr:Uncharacterised protein [Chlamydia trachomatis]